VILHIKAKPNSRVNKLIVSGNDITCHIKAPAIDDKANKELIKYLSEVFNTSKSSINLLKGQGNRYKKVEINLPESTINGILTRFIA